MAVTANEVQSERAITRWTRLHIQMHWLVVGLLVVQFLFGGFMESLFDSRVSGESASAPAIVLGLVHMATGIAVFFAIATRVGDHFINGRPPHPKGEPSWAKYLATVTQFLLYAIVLAMPVAGLVAFFAENDWLASMHSLASKALIVLVALHAAGAAANHYWFKTDVMEKMLPGHGRDVESAEQSAVSTR